MADHIGPATGGPKPQHDEIEVTNDKEVVPHDGKEVAGGDGKQAFGNADLEASRHTGHHNGGGAELPTNYNAQNMYNIDPKEERRVVRKIDLRLIPLVSALCE
jgi:hypothetical protein